MWCWAAYARHFFVGPPAKRLKTCLLTSVFKGDYSHTLILMVIILYFMFVTYATGSQIGSTSAMYRLLKDAALKRPVSGNQDGSYVTMKSNFALIFGVIQLCSGSGTVFLDQAYWQRAIASRPTTAVRAYILGGLAWYAIPFGFATTLGLAAVALTDSPSFPTFPNSMTQAQVSAGLSAPFAATALLGTGGAVALLIVLFMAVTSCASAELIAVSSILTFDVFKTYVKPAATPEQLITVAHIMIGVWGLVMAIFACIWNVIGIDLGWLFLVMGLLIGGAVFPAAFAITWKGQTKAGALSGAITGLCAGLIAWLVTAQQYYGSLSVSTTGMEYPTLAGNLAALMTGLVVTVAVSLFKPEPFSWDTTRSINAPSLLAPPSSDSIDKRGKEKDNLNNNNSNNNNSHLPTVRLRSEDREIQEDDLITSEPHKLHRAFKLACIASFLLTFAMDFIVPIPMFLSHYIFSQGFFTAWVVVTFCWVFCSTAISVILPVWETAGFFVRLWKEIVRRDGRENRYRR